MELVWSALSMKRRELPPSALGQNPGIDLCAAFSSQPSIVQVCSHALQKRSNISGVEVCPFRRSLIFFTFTVSGNWGSRNLGHTISSRLVEVASLKRVSFSLLKPFSVFFLCSASAFASCFLSSSPSPITAPASLSVSAACSVSSLR